MDIANIYTNKHFKKVSSTDTENTNKDTYEPIGDLFYRWSCGKPAPVVAVEIRKKDGVIVDFTVWDNIEIKLSSKRINN